MANEGLTVPIYSAQLSAQNSADGTKYISVTHDGTNGYIENTYGKLRLNTTSAAEIRDRNAVSYFNLNTVTGRLSLNGFIDDQFVLNCKDETLKCSMFCSKPTYREVTFGINNVANSHLPLIYVSKNPSADRDYAPEGNTGILIQGDENLNLDVRSLNPQEDNTYVLGKSGHRWKELYCADAVIKTSDQRQKENITNSNLGLDFINRLRPVSFKWKNYTATSSPDANGDTHQIQHTFVRKHYGLIAQEVKAVLDDLEIPTNDFAGYIRDETADTYGLRDSEFISPLIKAVQELSTRLTAVENALAAMH